jgi:hypothetical protein
MGNWKSEISDYFGKINFSGVMVLHLKRIYPVGAERVQGQELGVGS